MHKLKDAEVTAAARQKAEIRVAQLEAAIQAVQERAAQMVRRLEHQRCAWDCMGGRGQCSADDAVFYGDIWEVRITAAA